MDLPRVRGRLLGSRHGRCLIAVTCPFCGLEHRYGKGVLSDPEVQALIEQGFTDEWIPCQLDLPGNFYRVLLPRRGGRSSGDGRRRRIPDRAR